MLHIKANLPGEYMNFKNLLCLFQFKICGQLQFMQSYANIKLFRIAQDFTLKKAVDTQTGKKCS